MRHVLGRKDYEELVVLGHGDMVSGIRMEHGPAGQQREWLDKEYPKSTGQAVLELRARGLDASAAVLDYLIKKGVIRNPEGEGRSRQWHRGNIDEVARYMEAEQMYVPGAVARMVHNIDAAQDERAQREALRENPEITSVDMLVMEILPGAAGLGIPATVRYRPMTKEEHAEWRRRVNEAQKAARKGRKS